MANSPRLVEWSVWIYEKLILAYPVEFRKKYGHEMTLVFREMASDTLRQRGLGGLFLIWCRVLGDLLHTVPQEHCTAFPRRIIMKTTIRTLLWGLLAAFIHYFVFFSMAVLFMGLFFLFHGEHWLMRSNHTFFSLLEIAFFIPPPFVAGMILARTRPFFRPYLTAPLGIVMICGLVLCLAGVPENSPFASSIWGGIAYYCLGVVVVALLGLDALLGFIVATKLSERFSKPRTVRQITTSSI
jgi:hypothetical protein